MSPEGATPFPPGCSPSGLHATTLISSPGCYPGYSVIAFPAIQSGYRFSSQKTFSGRSGRPRQKLFFVPLIWKNRGLTGYLRPSYSSADLFAIRRWLGCTRMGMPIPHLHFTLFFIPDLRPSKFIRGPLFRPNHITRIRTKILHHFHGDPPIRLQRALARQHPLGVGVVDGLY